MPWKLVDENEARRSFIRAYRERSSMAALCREHGISRQSGYKWLARYISGEACTAHSRRPRAADRLRRRWYERLIALRRRYPNFGGKKLVWHLQQQFPLGPWPAPRTAARWLKSARLVQARKRRSRPGPRVPALTRVPAQAPNDVWTIDFKGWFYTGSGERVCALTVRDLASRYVLLVQHVPQANERKVSALLQRLFRRHGLPRAIRVDNGPPFGGMGPRGWSHLAVTWVRLGIQVDYSRPARPGDNAAHEQMHQVLKQRTASPPAMHLKAQQRRFERWRQEYNQARPHEQLNLHVPCAFYRNAPRHLPPQWEHPPGCQFVRTDQRGRCRWAQRVRLIGRAFANRTLGLLPLSDQTVQVYFGPHLLGELHLHDTAGLRAVQPAPTRGG